MAQNDVSKMRQAYTEFEELVHAYRSRMFLGVDVKRDIILIEHLSKIWFLEGVYSIHNGEFHDYDTVAVRLRKEIPEVIDVIIGKMRGLSKSLISPL
jgi:hypothetical protein